MTPFDFSRIAASFMELQDSVGLFQKSISAFQAVMPPSGRGNVTDAEVARRRRHNKAARKARRANHR